MTVEFKNKELVDEENLIYLKITGKLTTQDFDSFTPIMDQKIEKYGKVSMLVELNDFHGWTAGAAWEDAKLDLKHYSDFEKIAIVGDKSWEKGLAIFSKPFTAAKVRYFNANEEGKLEEAKGWIKENKAKQAACA